MNKAWTNILISPIKSIYDALQIIDNGSLRIALVVDQYSNLLGVVTDGDIRRGLLNGFGLDAQIQNVMSVNPRTAQVGITRKALLKIMEDEELLAIPILDGTKVVGIESLQKSSFKRYDNPIFLMAGGFGTRLKPLTNNCPKPLLKVGDTPILERVLRSFIRAGFHDFYISTHYLPEMIRDYFKSGEKWGVTIHYVHENEPLGTGGALGLLPKDLPDLPVIVMNGDVLTNIDFESLLATHNENNAIATMSVREYEYQVPFGVIESDGNKVTSMVEKPIQRFHVNAGIYVVSRKLINSVLANEVVDMPTLLERNLKETVQIYPFHDYWLDIGRIADFERAQIDVKSLEFSHDGK